MCISISIWHSGSGGSAIIGWTATNGITTYSGDHAWGSGGHPLWTNAEYLAIVTPIILGTSYFNKPASELCGAPPVPVTDNNIIILVIGLAIAYYYFMRDK